MHRNFMKWFTALIRKDMERYPENPEKKESLFVKITREKMRKK